MSIWGPLLGVPGGTSATAVGALGCRPDPDEGVLAPGQPHPGSGVPPSMGAVGVRTGISTLNMEGLDVHVNAGFSSSGMGGFIVQGGASASHEGGFDCRPDPDKGIPIPARSHHRSGLSHPLASPCSHRGSTVPSLAAVSTSHPSRCGALLPSSVSLLGYLEDPSLLSVL